MTPNSTVSSRLHADLWREQSRRHPRDAWAFAMAHRQIGGRPFVHLPALAAIARDLHPFVVIQKSAQVGLTELCVNLAIWAAALPWAARGNVLYLMPTQNQMDDFAQARFDRAIQDSPDLLRRLQPEPPRRKGADSKRLKRVANGWIFMRGADARRQVASVDADLVILDEYDQMADGILALARKRLASSRAGLLRVASTPRLPESGVNGLYLQSDQRRYHLPCPACAAFQPLEWDANVDQACAQLVCRHCAAPMDVMREGRWIAQAPGNQEIHGYLLNRLYSPWCDLPAMIAASQAVTPLALQEFYNSDLGEVFAPPGGGLSIDTLDQGRRDYGCDDYAGQPCDMGVDVGTKLHVIVREHRGEHRAIPGGFEDVRRDGPAPLWYAGTVDTFDALDALVARFQVQHLVIDAQPETRLAKDCATRHGGAVAYYSRHDGAHERFRAAGSEPARVQLDRTLAIDETFQRFRDGTATLPREARGLGGRMASGIGEYYRELLALKRALSQDADGNWSARWEHVGADHFAHAEVYCQAADWITAEERGSLFFA